jgi:hypothetical protein
MNDSLGISVMFKKAVKIRGFLPQLRFFLIWLNTDYVSSLEAFLNSDFEFTSVNQERNKENIAVARAFNGQW